MEDNEKNFTKNNLKKNINNNFKVNEDSLFNNDILNDKFNYLDEKRYKSNFNDTYGINNHVNKKPLDFSEIQFNTRNLNNNKYNKSGSSPQKNIINNDKVNSNIISNIDKNIKNEVINLMNNNFNIENNISQPINVVKNNEFINISESDNDDKNINYNIINNKIDKKKDIFKSEIGKEREQEKTNIFNGNIFKVDKPSSLFPIKNFNDINKKLSNINFNYEKKIFSPKNVTSNKNNINFKNSNILACKDLYLELNTTYDNPNHIMENPPIISNNISSHIDLLEEQKPILNIDNQEYSNFMDIEEPEKTEENLIHKNIIKTKNNNNYNFYTFQIINNKILNEKNELKKEFINKNLFLNKKKVYTNLRMYKNKGYENKSNKSIQKYDNLTINIHFKSENNNHNKNNDTLLKDSKLENNNKLNNNLFNNNNKKNNEIKNNNYTNNKEEPKKIIKTRQSYNEPNNKFNLSLRSSTRLQNIQNNINSTTTANININKNVSEKLKNKFKEIINELEKNKISEDFTHPVIDSLKGENEEEMIIKYKKQIKQPMDLETIKKNLDQINTIDDFVCKLYLICKNSYNFNEAKSEIYENTIQFEKLCSKMIVKHNLINKKILTKKRKRFFEKKKNNTNNNTSNNNNSQNNNLSNNNNNHGNNLNKKIKKSLKNEKIKKNFKNFKNDIINVNLPINHNINIKENHYNLRDKKKIKIEKSKKITYNNNNTKKENNSNNNNSSNSNINNNNKKIIENFKGEKIKKTIDIGTQTEDYKDSYYERRLELIKKLNAISEDELIELMLYIESIKPNAISEYYGTEDILTLNVEKLQDDQDSLKKVLTYLDNLEKYKLSNNDSYF